MTTTHYDETENSNTLPKGDYTAKCSRWAWDTTQNGDPCLACQFTLSSGKPGWTLEGRLYFDTEREDKLGRTAADRSLEALHAMGFEGDLSSLDGLDADPDCLTRGEVTLVVDVNEKGYNVVKFINAPRSTRELKVFAEPDVNTKQGFFAKMAARSKALAAKSSATGARPLGASNHSNTPRATPAQSSAADRAANRAASQNARPVAQASAAKPAPSAAPPRGPGLGARTDERFRDETPVDDSDIPF